MRRGLSRHSNKSSGNFFSPLSLFAGGVSGVWYDPSDSSTLFEDTAGTTPSPTPGGGALSVVGLMLDKSQGLVLSANVLSASWTVSAGATASGSSVTLNSASDVFAYQDVMTSGLRYFVTFDYNITSGQTGLYVGSNGGSGDTILSLSGLSGTGTYSGYFRASNTTFIFRDNSGCVASFTNITLRVQQGNHAISYNTTTARPELSARVNLLTYSEQFNNAAWNIQTNLTFTTGVTDPNGGSTATTITATVGSGRLLQSVTTGINVTSTASIWIRRRTGTGDINWEAVGVGVGPLINVTSTWQRVTYTATVLSGSIFYYGIRIATVGDAVDIAFGDIRPTNIGTSVPAYQRIADQYTYDSSGFPRYLAFNGTASGMYTPANLNLSATDKATVFAGVRKLSDAAVAILAELSANPSTNAGTFYLSSPESTGASGDFRFKSRGSLDTTPTTSGAYLAPTSRVLTGAGDIASDTAILRINGTQVVNTTSDQGTGNFGNYPLYIGSRANASLFLNGYIYSLIVVGAASTAAQISSTESWINVKEGGVY